MSFDPTILPDGRGWPAWWAWSWEQVAASSWLGNASQLTTLGGSAAASFFWNGTAPGHNFELDFFEFGWWQESPPASAATPSSTFTATIHDWVGAENQYSSSYYDTQADLAQPHAYGLLWQPATIMSNGSATWVFDRVPIPQTTVTWRHYDCDSPPADSHLNPSPSGTLYAVIDCQHMILQLNTGPLNPLRLYNVSVWQASNASNLYGAGWH